MHINFAKYDSKSNQINKKFKIPNIYKKYSIEEWWNYVFLMNKKQYIKKKKAHQGHAPKYTDSIQEKEKGTP